MPTPRYVPRPQLQIFNCSSSSSQCMSAGTSHWLARFVHSAGAVRVRGSPMEQNLPPAILVVEDEAMVAMDLADCVTDAGYRVLGPIDTLSEAPRIGAAEVFDAALLDANL